MMMKKLIALLVCILLLATAQAEAPANTSAAETTEYGWALKIGRTAAKGMPIQDLLNTLAAQDCPAVFAVGGWTGIHGRGAVGVRRVCDALVPRRGAHHAQY